MQFSLSGALGLALVLLAFFAWGLWSDNRAKADQIDTMSTQIELRLLADQAGARARRVSGAGRDEIEALLRQFFREHGLEPTSEACRADPAIGRAYDTIDRMSDTHGNAIRAASE